MAKRTDPRQLSLTSREASTALGQPIVHRGPSKTSQKAGASIIGHAGTDEAKVLLALAEEPGTDDSLEKRLKMRHQTASARRRGLVIKCLVKDSGKRAETRSGRNAKVWEVTAKGWEAVKVLRDMTKGAK